MAAMWGQRRPHMIDWQGRAFKASLSEALRPLLLQHRILLLVAVLVVLGPSHPRAAGPLRDPTDGTPPVLCRSSALLLLLLLLLLLHRRRRHHLASITSCISRRSPGTSCTSTRS